MVMQLFVGVYCLILPLVLSSTPDLNDKSKIILCSGCKQFANGISNYTSFTTIVKEKNSATILVGVRGGVMKMTMDAQLIHFTRVPFVRNDHNQCIKNLKSNLDKTYGCGSIVTAIYPFPDSNIILACGISSGNPNICWKLNGTKVIGKPLVYNIFTNPVRHYVISHIYIYQAYAQMGRKARVSQTDIFRKTLGARNTQEFIFDHGDVDFVSIYELGDYIYVFFTEKSEEHVDKMASVRYARVARLCKYEQGGIKTPFANYDLLTFSKTRLLCPVTHSDGTVTQYNYLDMTSVVHVKDGKTYIYGVFRRRKGDDQFALCRYLLSDVERVFEDTKYYEISSETRYQTLKLVDAAPKDWRYLKCNPSILKAHIRYADYKLYRMRIIHKLNIHPDGGKPVITRRHPRFDKILADSSVISSFSYHVIRLFDSNLLFEVFVSFKSHHDKVHVTVRKIDEEPLIIQDVKSTKYDHIPPTVSSTIPTTHSKPMVLSTRDPSETTFTPNMSSALNSNQTFHSNMSISVHVNTTTEKREVTTEKPSSTMTTTTSPWKQSIIPEKIIVATKTKLLFVPLSSCNSLKTCRECISVMNPYCAWSAGTCIQLKPTGQRSSYIQDLHNGDYSKVCPQVPVSCVLTLENKLVVNKEIVLKCSTTGIPTPVISKWFRNDVQLLSQNSMVSITGKQLKIFNYTLPNSGRYTCHVTNNVMSYNCSFTIPGSTPTIHCTWKRMEKKFRLSCNVAGYPEIMLVLMKSGVIQAVHSQSTDVTIEENTEYQLVAYNTFGVNSTGVYKIISRKLEFKVDSKEWYDELTDPDSAQHKDLKTELFKGIEKLYKGNSLFHDAVITFRKGSVIVIVELKGLKTPNTKETDLTGALQEVIERKGKVGDFTITDVNDNNDKESTTEPPDQQSTHASSRSPSVTSEATRSSTLDKPTTISTHSPKLTTSTLRTDSPEKVKVPQKSSSTGVPVWLLIVLLIIIGLLVFFLGYFCGQRGFLPLKYFRRSQQRSRHSSYSEDDKEMSRSEKTRESERMLLKRIEGKTKKESSSKSPVKENNHDHSSNASKRGSIEITLNCVGNEDSSRPHSHHSVC